MQQLLQITVTRPRYEMEIEHARLEYRQDFQPSADVQTTPAELKIESTPASVKLDSYEARKSVGIVSVKDQVYMAAEKGRESLYRSIRENVIEGQQLSRIDQGVTIADIIGQKLTEHSQVYTAFLPSAGVDITVVPSEFRMEYQEGNTNYDWNVKSNTMSYVPGSVRMRMLEKGDIEIQYLGSPLYFPRSADPSYEESVVG